MANVLGILQADAETFLKGNDSGEGLSNEAIENFIQERIDAKLAKNYGRADEVRTLLLEQGVVLEDSKDGTTWRRE